MGLYGMKGGEGGDRWGESQPIQWMSQALEQLGAVRGRLGSGEWINLGKVDSKSL